MATALNFIMLTSDNDFVKNIFLRNRNQIFCLYWGRNIVVSPGVEGAAWEQCWRVDSAAAYDHEVNNLCSSFTLLLHLLYTYYVVYICNSQRQKL